ncbi:MAG: ferrous iron transport protein B [Christensenellales bacterium]|jgi:ferrous iron transport protein B
MYIKADRPCNESTPKNRADDPGRVIALAGNPNVGKSTVFNALTGMKQHTGNWPGKTVVNVQGRHTHNGESFRMVDLPGTYSLLAHSAEEEVARDYICFGDADAVIVVCDATCLERNLNLVLQTLEITGNVVVCVNLMDEAKKKKISIDLPRLSELLGCPVAGCSARSKKGLKELMDQTAMLCRNPRRAHTAPVPYIGPLEEAIALVEPVLLDKLKGRLNSRWAAIRLIEGDAPIIAAMERYLGCPLSADAALAPALDRARALIEKGGVPQDRIRDAIVNSIISRAEMIAADTVRFENAGYALNDRRLDRILTSKSTGIPIMIALLAILFWITMTGANYPSELIANGLAWVGNQLTGFFHWLGAPAWVRGILVDGVYKVVSWVVSVMLPPMAIFFPLFTLLEDFGYLPRVAFNLDRYFKKCCACGKQALTMCMGFGCNAAGVVGCRIIDSPRERLIAIITNNFVPCNGRFPTLIAIITMFFGSLALGFMESFVSALMLTGVIVLGVVMTLAVSKFLSKTILKGIPSSFVLELPPYRKPQIGRVIVRSILDRTLFVLGRAVVVAAPAGLIIWLMANIHVGGISLLAHCTGFLDPFARLFGLDGVILMAFVLGFPANEIVVPIIIMAYMSTGSILELDGLHQLKALLVQNHWTWLTALCTMLFSLMHFPCSTTCLTIRKETQSWKWTAVSFVLPTITGLALCFIVANTVRLLGLV